MFRREHLIQQLAERRFDRVRVIPISFRQQPGRGYWYAATVRRVIAAADRPPTALIAPNAA